MSNIVKRNEGIPGIKTAFIFACPGQEEEKSGRLVNGQTGKNLDAMLGYLKAEMPELFPSVDRYDYRITNSSESVHYMAFDGRTEPSRKEIKSPENLERLASDISGYDVIITFGNSAAFAAEKIKGRFPDVRFLYSRHLSFLSLNSGIKTDIDGNPIQRGAPDSTAKRLEVAADEILRQLR